MQKLCYVTALVYFHVLWCPTEDHVSLKVALTQYYDLKAVKPELVQTLLNQAVATASPHVRELQQLLHTHVIIVKLNL